MLAVAVRIEQQFLRECLRLVESQLAVGQCEGLLRHYARLAHVAFGHARVVEQLQELHLFFGRRPQIDAPAFGRKAKLVIDFGTAHR